MTKTEKIIVSLYTGYLMVDFDELHEFAQKTLGRPIWTHEFADPKVQEELRERLKPMFLDLCKEDTPEMGHSKWIHTKNIFFCGELVGKEYMCEYCGQTFQKGIKSKEPLPSFCYECNSVMDKED